jgi:hypothetical protein
MADAFFLAYGGLHWGFAEIRQLTLRQRAAFVETLHRQLASERERIAQ